MSILEENYQKISPQVRELLFDEDEPVDREDNNLLFAADGQAEQEQAEQGAEPALDDKQPAEEAQEMPADEVASAAPAGDNGWQEAKKLWPQIGSSHNARALIARMSELAGDGEGRRVLAEHPQLVMKLAALDLYGAPVSVDQKLIEQAKQAGREEARREAAARGSKTARAAAVGKKSPPDAPSLEDKIRQEIYEAGGKGLFG